MKAVCAKHQQAYEVNLSCPWCVPENADTLDDLPALGVHDIYLPNVKYGVKGYKETFSFNKRISVMLHLQESATTVAELARWDGALISCAAYRHAGAKRERSFFLDQAHGSWVASYQGLDGKVWKAYLVADYLYDKWEFRISEFV